jgi:hypothetical protein
LIATLAFQLPGQKMNQQPLITLLVAFFGALIAAGLSYIVRRILDDKALRRAEKRLAYVHFVHLSDMVALQIGLKSIVQASLPSNISYGFPQGEHFTLSHILFNKAAAELKKINLGEKFRELPISTLLSLVIDQQIEKLSHSQLSLEQLSKLPEQSVKEYLQFSKSLGEMTSLLTYIKAIFEDDSKLQRDLNWLTPEALSGFWKLLERFTTRTQKARNILGLLAAVSPTASSALLKEQLELVNNQVFDAMAQKTALIAAASAIAQAEIEKANEGAKGQG